MKKALGLKEINHFHITVLIPLNSASCSAPKQPLVPIETGHILSE
jgi:hypothetical protein